MNAIIPQEIKYFDTCDKTVLASVDSLEKRVGLHVLIVGQELSVQFKLLL